MQDLLTRIFDNADSIALIKTKDGQEFHVIAADFENHVYTLNATDKMVYIAPDQIATIIEEENTFKKYGF